MLHDQDWLNRFLYSLSVNVSAIFRDPGFYRSFRNEVVPLLRTYPFVRIWLAGVSMGEEVYSLAILLQEEGLYDRCRIYATDINDSVLKKAKEGIYPLDLMQSYTSNYIKAGGDRDFRITIRPLTTGPFSNLRSGKTSFSRSTISSGTRRSTSFTSSCAGT